MLLAYRTSDPSCKEVDNLNIDHEDLEGYFCGPEVAASEVIPKQL